MSQDVTTPKRARACRIVPAHRTHNILPSAMFGVIAGIDGLGTGLAFAALIF